MEQPPSSVDGVVTIVKDYSSTKGFLFATTAEYGAKDSGRITRIPKLFRLQ